MKKVEIQKIVDELEMRFMDITGKSYCYYFINPATYSDSPTISFFKFNDDGNIINKEDKRNIKNWNDAQFDMWDYGLSETENIITYYKQ